MEQHCTLPSYVLITPVRNEAGFIEKTIESVIRQTVLPMKWVIVDDASTDKTAEIVGYYLARHPWMEMVRMPERRDRSFAAKVGAFNAGYQRVKQLEYDVIGNLDGDLTCESDHLEFLLRQFSQDPKLGVAGSFYKEERGFSSERDSFAGYAFVPGLCQLFRRQCWEEIGGYLPLREGGEDCAAVTTARMMGWKTRAFPERCFTHLRPSGSAQLGILSRSFSGGKQDYYLGGHPAWELFRMVYQATRPPYFIRGFALGLGYYWALLRGTPRGVSAELVAFHRKEQMAKLKIILKSVLTFKTIDKFDLLAD